MPSTDADPHHANRQVGSAGRRMATEWLRHVGVPASLVARVHHQLAVDEGDTVQSETVHIEVDVMFDQVAVLDLGRGVEASRGSTRFPRCPESAGSGRPPGWR